MDGPNSFPERRLAPVVDLLVNVVAGDAFLAWIRIPNEFLRSRLRDTVLPASPMAPWFAPCQRRRFGQEKNETENRYKFFHLIAAGPSEFRGSFSAAVRWCLGPRIRSDMPPP